MARTKISSVGMVPVGAVVAYLKSYTNAPTLPAQYVECNGQTLSDAESVFNSQTIPDLNGALDTIQKFLRGATTSGGTGGSDSNCHSVSTVEVSVGTGLQVVCSVDSVDGKPPFYEVVWVMRIK